MPANNFNVQHASDDGKIMGAEFGFMLATYGVIAFDHYNNLETSPLNCLLIWAGLNAIAIPACSYLGETIGWGVSTGLNKMGLFAREPEKQDSHFENQAAPSNKWF